MSDNDTPESTQPPETPETEAQPTQDEARAAAAESLLHSLANKQAASDGDGQNVNAMLNVGLSVQIVLGQSRIPISQLLNLSRGSVIELEKKIGEPVDVVINDRLVARGDLVKVGENRLGVTLTEIVKDYVPTR
ncbi:FliM/FliN family flagellar motor switch protein [Thioclava sp. JE_KL1]|uniref:FliM/FliN family flagellar motor switch protein n=1 Tax=Thioclava sp. JE_KL1 TaxID=2651187 RepID=UPI00128B083D|nr:FliM/FliN family flagellar motor switch protein [Thioclava sp. JE_KL1]MPQ95069.1 flagellar motor switch protein FliN [Thioclava sp. JE_KL1]